MITVSKKNFYPRPPRGGRPVSTTRKRCSIDFYPRPPRGGRQPRPRPHEKKFYFYPRPPRGGRLLFSAVGFGGCGFLSTPSARRATVFFVVAEHHHAAFLSTPSARRATDTAHRPRSAPADFYPRPPRGGRLPLFLWYLGCKTFLSTPSGRRATRQRAKRW